jgi:hypothetical protein
MPRYASVGRATGLSTAIRLVGSLTKDGCPIPPDFLVECCGIPLKPKDGLTSISCHAVPERSGCAPFIKERRMECINATNLRRKSGPWGTQTLLLVQGVGVRAAVS